MDPIACLMRSDTAAAYADMRQWIARGGFKPTETEMRLAGCPDKRVRRLVRMGLVTK